MLQQLSFRSRGQQLPMVWMGVLHLNPSHRSCSKRRVLQSYTKVSNPRKEIRLTSLQKRTYIFFLQLSDKSKAIVKSKNPPYVTYRNEQFGNELHIVRNSKHDELRIVMIFRPELGHCPTYHKLSNDNCNRIIGLRSTKWSARFIFWLDSEEEHIYHNDKKVCWALHNKERKKKHYINRLVSFQESCRFFPPLNTWIFQYPSAHRLLRNRPLY